MATFATFPLPAGDGVCGHATEAAEREKSYCIFSAELNRHQSLLDRFKPSLFDAVSRSADAYRPLKRHITRVFSGQLVSNAWLKMYELAYRFDLASFATAGVLRLFCNAELPGAFVSALNHYCCNASATRSVGIKWCASSLYPQDLGEGHAATKALKDQYGLLRAYRRAWIMDGPGDPWGDGAKQMDGDLVSPENVATMAVRARSLLGEIDLYTSDAGLDVGEDFNRREELNLRIHFGQALAGLLSLRDGGAAVLKMYTFFLPFTRSVIAVLASRFESFDVCKPQTSRPANSEIYLVGRGFHGIDQKTVRGLLEKLGPDPVKGTFLYSVPLAGFGPADTTEEFNEALWVAARALFSRQQPAHLKRLARLCDVWEKKKQGWKATQKELSRSSKERTGAWLAAMKVAEMLPGRALKGVR